MNRREFLGYGGATLLVGASGMILPRLAGAAGTAGTGATDADGIKLEHLKYETTGAAKSYCNWYFNVSFDHGGLPYVLFGAIQAPGFSGKKEVTVLGVRGPFKSRKEKALDIEEAEEGLVKDEADKTSATEDTITVIDNPEWHFRKVFIKEDHEFEQTLTQDSVSIRAGNTKMHCTEGNYKLRLDEKGYKMDLDCVSRGPAIWWGGGVKKEFHLTKGSIQNGFESPCDIEGTAVINGEKLTIKGRGVFEHVWITKLDMMELRSVDYIAANYDQAYMFLFKGISATNSDSCLHHNHAGGICLTHEKKVHYITGIKIGYRNWAYSPKAYRFIPTVYEVTAETEAGVLKTTMEPLATPSWYVHRRMEKLALDNTEGYNFCYWDAPFKAEGEFRYKDGKVIKLTNGRGVNEPQKVSSLV
jgi:hypothetical protein